MLANKIAIVKIFGWAHRRTTPALEQRHPSFVKEESLMKAGRPSTRFFQIPGHISKHPKALFKFRPQKPIVINGE